MKKRLDILVTERGLAESREKAKSLIMAGQIYVDNQKADKPGDTFPEECPHRIPWQRPALRQPGRPKAGKRPWRNSPSPWRAKPAWTSAPLPAALPTACFKRAPRKVYAVDVGYGQLAWNLRNDPRVVNL